MLNSRCLSYMAFYDVVSNIWRALALGVYVLLSVRRPPEYQLHE
jgi:hypothetical protein